MRKAKKIIVFGGCSVDYTYKQKEDGSYSNIPTFVAFGGKGSNQAVACSRAGGQVYMISRLGGKDEEEVKNAKDIIKNLQENGVNTDFVEIMKGVENDTSYINVSLEGENDIKRKTGAIDSFTIDMIDKYSKVLKNADFVIAQMKIPKEVSKELIKFCHKNNVFLVLTPCRPLRLRGEDELLEKINIITCNHDECSKIFGDLVKDKDNKDKYVLTEEKMQEVLKRFPNKLIVTLGSNGVIYHDGKKVVKLPALEVDNVVDTTGAGDTLNGNLVASLAEGKSLRESIIDGMKAATIKLKYNGAQEGMPKRQKTEKIHIN
jgi:ribokinase